LPLAAQQGSVIAARAAWARIAAPGVPVAAGYLQLVNSGPQADELVGASSPRARSVQIHQTQIVEGVMRMREAPSVTLAPGALVVFEPGGLHLMIMGVDPALNEGDELPVILRFKQAGEQTVVLRLSARAPPSDPSVKRR
jgi:copper(I)-binding protein